MQIHRVKDGETIYSIATDYGVSPTKIIEINGIKQPDKLSVGRELLILVPTRTYTVRKGDCISAISRRFSVSEREILKNNPSLSGRDKIYPEEILALKYPEKSHGIMLLNGYAYKGCKESDIKRIIPYLSHITAAVCVYEGGKIHFFEDAKSISELAIKNKKSPLLRIYPKSFEVSTESDKLISEATRSAKANGYSGITLPIPKAEDEKALTDFLLSLKKATLEYGLTLNLESDKAPGESISTLSDSIVLTADDNFISKEQSPNKDSLKLYRDYAKCGEPLSAFIDLSPFAYLENKAIPIDEAAYMADAQGAPLSLSENETALSFSVGKKTVIMPSLKSLKAKLDLIGELGFLGCAIDIARCPISHLMMLSSLFALSPDYFSGGI